MDVKPTASADRLDRPTRGACARELLVTVDQRGVERLGERDARGIVGGVLVPQAPDPGDQRLRGLAAERHTCQVPQVDVGAYSALPRRKHFTSAVTSSEEVRMRTMQEASTTMRPSLPTIPGSRG